MPEPILSTKASGQIEPSVRSEKGVLDSQGIIHSLSMFTCYSMTPIKAANTLILVALLLFTLERCRNEELLCRILPKFKKRSSYRPVISESDDLFGWAPSSWGSTPTDSSANMIDAENDGHWRFTENITSPYDYSRKVCEATFMYNKADCRKTKQCPSNLMNWEYIDNKSNEPYPRFDVSGFRERMKNRRILFIGSSLMRQQVYALIWSLGHKRVKWKTKFPIPPSLKPCTTRRHCFTDAQSNITICRQFLCSMATTVYSEGNFTLDHALRGKGDSSCLLQDEMMEQLTGFDLVFVQSLTWWTNLPTILDSPSSPMEWVAGMVPTMYYDAMKLILTKLSRSTKTVLVLGQTGVDCADKTEPEPFSIAKIPDQYGWSMSPKLWDASLKLIEREGLNVQVVDARTPLMQSVHSHPPGDCLHFCMNSAAVNIYLDMYYREVFSNFNGHTTLQSNVAD